MTSEIDIVESALQRAIRVVGSQTALAALLGGRIRQGHVSHWLKSGRVPAEHCPAIEDGTERQVRCEDLRPDVKWHVLRCPHQASSGPRAACVAPVDGQPD